MHKTSQLSPAEMSVPAIADDVSFEESFQNPSAALRGKPFWSWNGQLDQGELLRQIEVLETMGMGGAFMHSRTGLKNTYLGDVWFDLIAACAERCAAKGLEGWIYDEDRWPSGTAGGQVTQASTHRMRSLVLSVFGPGERIVWPERADFIEAHQADLDGLALAAYQPVEFEGMEDCPEGATILLMQREIHGDSSFYNGGAYLNTLSRAATDAFIESTHEKYRAACGDAFGHSIKGIFTDEPHRGFILCDKVEQPGARNAAYSIPYSEELFTEFEAAFGYPLRGRLPELFYHHRGEKISQLKWHYAELLQRLFLRNWAQPCADWCERNNLKLTGHVLHEDSLTAQVVPVGSLLRYYETMSYPGIDVLSRRCESFWVAKQVVSTARQLGKPYVLSELYGATGWDMGFDEHKRIGDWQAFQGVNLRCPHLSWYSMAGESKRDYPASIFHQSAWYPEYKYVEDYFARIHWVLGQGEPDCDVLVVHPGESLWAQFHLGWATWLGSNSPVIDQVEAKFATLYHWLADAQVDFDYGDEEQMERLGSVEVIDAEAFFKLGQMRYRSIVVGGMDTLRGSTLDVLRRFAKAGGSIVFAGAAPEYVDALPCDAATAFATEIGTAGWNQESVLRAVRHGSEQVLRVNGGEGVEGLISQVRRVENGDIFVGLVNRLEVPIRRVRINLEAVGQVERLNCRDGSILPMAVRSSSEGLDWTLDFEPLQEHLFRVRVNQLETAWPPDAPRKFEHSLVLQGPFDYKLSESNALVLDRASVCCESIFAPGERVDVLQIDDRIRTHLGWALRTGTMLQPWCRKDAPKAGPELRLDFTFQIEALPPALRLVMEQPERWVLCLNGVEVAMPTETSWTIDIALRELPLPQELLRIGGNALSLTTAFQEDTDLEAIYLMGEFGVYARSEGFALGELPANLEIGTVTHQGLPFYSGEIAYKKELPRIPVGQSITCELPAFAGACAQVEVDGQGGLLAFPPYCLELTARQPEPLLSIRVILSRQNLMGPFHRVPKDEIMTGPASFRTSGAAYTPAYELFPAGLLQPPLIRF